MSVFGVPSRSYKDIPADPQLKDLLKPLVSRDKYDRLVAKHTQKQAQSARRGEMQMYCTNTLTEAHACAMKEKCASCGIFLWIIRLFREMNLTFGPKKPDQEKQ